MRLTYPYFIIACSILVSCNVSSKIKISAPDPLIRITGTSFYKTAASYNWQQRDSLAVQEILAGNMPSFIKDLVRINVSLIDSSTGKTIKGHYFVTPDYLSVGTDEDWARVPLTPMAAQIIADSFKCFLPTRKIADDIYKAAAVKPDPIPMFAFRDSSVTMWQHHLMIEGQRKARKGLIAGIKKDVIISDKLSASPKKDRVAIYGWHRPDGKPIQPIYTGHVNRYVDYSHGIRLVYRTIWIEGTQMDYVEVLKHPLYRALLCDEATCNVNRY